MHNRLTFVALINSDLLRHLLLQAAPNPAGSLGSDRPMFSNASDMLLAAVWTLTVVHGGKSNAGRRCVAFCRVAFNGSQLVVSVHYAFVPRYELGAGLRD